VQLESSHYLLNHNKPDRNCTENINFSRVLRSTGFSRFDQFWANIWYRYEVAFQIKLKYGGFCPLPPCPQIAWVPLFSSEKALTLKIGGLGSKTHEKLRRLQTN
jgi:hypothetical protein